MAARAIAVFLLLIPALAEERAVLFQSGPFEVQTTAGEKAGRETLNALEQFRHTFGTMLGKPDAASIWPIRVRVVRTAKAFATPATLEFHRDGWDAVVNSPADLHGGFFRQLGRILLDANAAPMPAWADDGLVALFSTLSITGPKVAVGEPPPAAERTRNWARMHMLATSDDYAGRLRVFFSNLQRTTDPEPCYRNAFEKSQAEIEKQLDAYIAAGRFQTASLSGKPIDASRDFYAKAPPAPAKSAVDILEAGDLPGAAKANPRWAEPLYRMALKEADPEQKLAGIRKAIALEPRNPRYRESLTAAIAQNKLAIEEAERNRKEAAARELERLKDEALRRVREAEMRANQGGTRVDSAKVQDWWDGPKLAGHIDGTLQRVDCQGGTLRLTIAPATGKPVLLMVRKPGEIAIHGGGTTMLSCGVQKPARRVGVDYDPKPDAKAGTSGDAAAIEFK